MRRRLTDDQRRAQRTEALERLQTQAEALLTSDGWRGWLRTRATLHSYSANNTLLLPAQALERGFELTHVAGFQAWLRLGRCVGKGERGLKVFAPMPTRRREAGEEDQDQEAGEDQQRRRMRFGLATVFDVSQTDPLPDVDPAPLRPPIQPLGGDSHERLLAPLMEFGRSIGYPVSLADLGRAHGRCDHHARTITLTPGHSANHTVAVLIHELAHALLGRNDLPYAVEEVVVEATAYIATAAAGLDAQPSAVPYIASWGGDDPVATVHAAANQIDELASRLQAVIEDHRGRPVNPPAAAEALATAA